MRGFKAQKLGKAGRGLQRKNIDGLESPGKDKRNSSTAGKRRDCDGGGKVEGELVGGSSNK